MKIEADPSFYASFSELQSLKQNARAQDPQALREAARQFESIFARMLISSMRSASFGDSLLGSERRVQALVEGAILGGYRAGRWKTGEQPPSVDRFVVCGARQDLRAVAERAALVARWTNVARELVDALALACAAPVMSSVADASRSRKTVADATLPRKLIPTSTVGMMWASSVASPLKLLLADSARSTRTITATKEEKMKMKKWPLKDHK